ncbi:D(2) dopamine receptor-like [Patiria miniata]|uniref:G-protein coupled receptors family 1 profile domain-containing protein n=1 Tax=Patiria miniata TaxID=46514 RepID=A0A913Z4U6_PATMI|nr:D(2) dopamine receptor-like [Patiria miniata]
MASTDVTVLPPSSGIDEIRTDGAIWRGIVNFFITLFGLFGNSLILRVYWRKARKRSTEVLIMGLAGVDLTVCLLRIRNVVEFTYTIAGVEVPFVVRILVAPCRIALGTSVVMTGVIALDRYDSVCRFSKRFLNKRRAKIAILVSIVIAVVLESPSILSGVILSPNLKKFAYVCYITGYLTILLMTTVCYGNVYAAIKRQRKVHIGLERTSSEPPAIPTISHNIPTLLRRAKVSRMRVEPLDSGSECGPSTSASTSMMRRSEPQHPTSSTSRTSTSKYLRPYEQCNSSKARSRQPTEESTQNGRPFLKPSPVSDARGQSWAVQTSVLKRIRWREPPSGNQPSMRELMQRRVTRMLFITSVVFLLTWLPFWIYVATDLFVLNGGTVDQGVLAKMFSSAILSAVNSTVNPLIYGLANRQFRKDCAVLFRK